MHSVSSKMGREKTKSLIIEDEEEKYGSQKTMECDTFT